tara:strand:+ start:30928 stop:32112 length:1185 start_codon:yes stop_codon:yes gene_type:complete
MILPAHLYRYVLKAHIGPFLFAFIIITFILVMDIIFRIANLIIEKNLDVFIVLEVFILNLAWIVALSIIMAVLVSTLIAFGRLAADNEITALKSAGVSFYQMIFPVLVAALFLGAGHLYFMDVVLPEANYRARSLMDDIHRARPTLLFPEGVFITKIPGYSILIDRVNPTNNKIYSITIYETKNRQYPRLLTAKYGEFSVNKSGSHITLILYNGEILHYDEASSRYFKEVFKKQKLVIRSQPSGVQRSEASTRSDRELNIAMMRRKIENWQIEIDQLNKNLGNVDSEVKRKISIRQRQINSYLVEIHKKYAMSAAWIVFVLIGASLGIRIKRGSIGMSVGISLGVFLLYWTCLLGGEELADRTLFDPVLAMWSANILIGIPGVVLVWFTGKEQI